MNFELAFLWTALLAANGFFGYIFYMVVKEHRDKKDKSGNNNKKRKGLKPHFAPAGIRSKAKADAPETNNGFQPFDIYNSYIEVINISNCPFNS